MADGPVEREFARSALRRCALFARMDDPTLDTVCGSLRVRRYRRNETIFHQGDPGDALYIVESGSVKVVLPSPEGEDAAIIATLDRGDFFGGLARLAGAEHSAPAVAVEATQTLVLRREPFEVLVEEQPALRRALIAGLVAELRRLTSHVGELHFLDLPGRLASRIVTIARATDPAAVSDIVLEWPYTQSDLASMIGGTRQTVNRLLQDLVTRGLIRLEREHLVIPDLEALARSVDR
ncbi:MAG: Crp/Fnr family transcriptional regulator [Candidatus Limnocylindrales bacterium]